MLVLGTVMKAVIYFLLRITPVDRMSGVTVTKKNEIEEIGREQWPGPSLLKCPSVLSLFL